MGYSILRTQKLKDKGSVRRSLKHAFREQDTPNADASRKEYNIHIGAKSADEAMQKFNARLPDKVRKNAVLAIEYLITGSPEVVNFMTESAHNRFFNTSLDWLKARHGAENIIYAGIHRDEHTPHMYAYVVPIDERGKLNCRAFLGGRHALSEMQTDFAENVGKTFGLLRGVKGSKATHQRVSQFYGQINQFDPTVEVPHERQIVKRGLLRNEYESDFEFSERVSSSVLKQLEPTIEKSRLSTLEGRRKREHHETNAELRKRNEKLLEAVNGMQKPFQGLSPEQAGMVVQHAFAFQQKNREALEKRQQEKINARQRERGREQDFER